MNRESWLLSLTLTFPSVPGVVLQLLRFTNVISLVCDVRGLQPQRAISCSSETRETAAEATVHRRSFVCLNVSDGRNTNACPSETSALRRLKIIGIYSYFIPPTKRTRLCNLTCIADARWLSQEMLNSAAATACAQPQHKPSPVECFLMLLS